MPENRSIANTLFIILYGGVAEFYYPLRWFLFLAIILIYLDQRWGTALAKKRGEKTSTLKAMRAGLGSFIDYTCWVTLAAVFGRMFNDESWMSFLNIQVIGVTVSQLFLLVFVYSMEFIECYQKWSELKGGKRLDLEGLFRRKTGIDIIEKKPEYEEFDLTKE